MSNKPIILTSGMHGALQDHFKKHWEQNQHLFPAGANQKFMEDLVRDNLNTFAGMFLRDIVWKANHELTQSAPKEEGH